MSLQQSLHDVMDHCYYLSETNWYNVVVWMVTTELLNINMFIDYWSIVVLPSIGSL
jgi:hypothetical protein